MPKSKEIISVLLIIVFFTGIVFIQRNVKIANPDEEPEYDLYYIPNPEYLHIVSAGFREFLADVYWIRTVQYFGRRTDFDDIPLILARLKTEKVVSPKFYEIRERNRVKFRYLYDLCNVITELDPYFLDAYTFAGLFLSFKLDRPDLSIKILEKGLKNIPDNWQIPYHLGFNYYFYIENKEKAVDYFMKAGEMTGCPPGVISLAQGILVEQGKTEIAIDFIQGVRDRTDKEDIRSEMDRVLEQLKAGKGNNSLKKADKSL